MVNAVDSVSAKTVSNRSDDEGTVVARGRREIKTPHALENISTVDERSPIDSDGRVRHGVFVICFFSIF